MAKKKAPETGETIYKLKVTLRGFKPAIWRRVELRDCSLGRLYPILLQAMGWGGHHMHCFRVGDTTYGEPDPELEFENEDRVKLSDLVKRGVKKFVWEYDFGDSWEHDVAIEKPVAVEEGAKYPRVTAGENACPPDDCGGVWGYSDLLDILADPEHEEYEERLEWLGGAFDPQAFDLEEVNGRLPGRK